ncbi:hypothetical protein [Shewanella surugensis]|uniref:Lipoprotein n=1 Tax=Shewanella surugensis TaxID=212020 RepID=A0ABT0L798_9GAMM|nr:hypothetical protein [Shewanella surugensis]MCL1123563.1 hypothetical protein [Shewanella surugensis]
MVKILLGLFILSISGCSYTNALNTSAADTNTKDTNKEGVNAGSASGLSKYNGLCNGSLPLDLQSLQFISHVGEQNEVIGKPGAGKLCQANVYRVKKEITVWRTWNSEYQPSAKGKWWTFNMPMGAVSEYRQHYEICPSYSPIDKLIKCTLIQDEQIIVGTGQSATCSQYLTYKTSSALQVYIDDAAVSVKDCSLYNGQLSWTSEPR